MYIHHYLTKVLVLSCVNKSFHIGSHSIYLYWLVCHWRLKMTPLVLYFSRWVAKADCVEMLIPNEQKAKWNQISWHEFEVLMYCNLLKYSWITNPSDWTVLIITAMFFLTLNYVRKQSTTRDLEWTVLPSKECDQKSSYFQNSLLWYPAPPKKSHGSVPSRTHSVLVTQVMFLQ